MLVVADACRRSELAMPLSVAVDDVATPPIPGARGMSVFGWKQSQAEDAKRRQARKRPPPHPVRHLPGIISGDATPVKHVAPFEAAGSGGSVARNTMV